MAGLDVVLNLKDKVNTVDDAKAIVNELMRMKSKEMVVMNALIKMSMFLNGIQYFNMERSAELIYKYCRTVDMNKVARLAEFTKYELELHVEDSMEKYGKKLMQGNKKEMDQIYNYIAGQFPRPQFNNNVQIIYNDGEIEEIITKK